MLQVPALLLALPVQVPNMANKPTPRKPQTRKLPAGTLAAAGAASQPVPLAANPMPPLPAAVAQMAQAATAAGNPQVGSAIAQVAHALAGSMATHAPGAPVAPVTVALRGGPAIALVHSTGKPYRVAAAHNQGWWALVGAVLAQGGGTASVQALLAAGVPAPFVGYTLRRGHLAAGALATA